MTQHTQNHLHVAEVLREEPGDVVVSLHHALTRVHFPLLLADAALAPPVARRLRADRRHARVRDQLHIVLRRVPSVERGVHDAARGVVFGETRLVRADTLPGGVDEAVEEVFEEHEVLLAVHVGEVLRGGYVLRVKKRGIPHLEVVVEGDVAQLAVARFGLLLLHVPLQVGLLPRGVAHPALLASNRVVVHVVQLPFHVLVHSTREGGNTDRLFPKGLRN